MEIETTLYEKRPQDRIDYDIDFARFWLEGDTIATVDSVTVGEDTTVEIDGFDFTTGSVKVWLIGGTVGETARVTVRVTTTQGRTKTVCFKVRVREVCA